MTRGVRRFRRGLSPALFAAIALSFLLPFATVSCDEERTRFTGVQLVTKTVPPALTADGSPSDLDEEVEAEASVHATVVLAAAMLGFLLAALGFRIGPIGPGLCAAVGLGATLTLPLQAGALGPDVDFHAGYLAVLVLYVMVSALHAGACVSPGVWSRGHWSRGHWSRGQVLH